MKHDALTLLGGSMPGLRVPTEDFGSDVPPSGTLAMTSQGLVISRNGALDLIYDMGADLYDFVQHRFTNAGRSGRLGPSLSDFVTAYAGTPFIADRTLFNSEDGIQVWTVPANGVYEIRAIGATRPSMNTGGTDRRPIIQGNFALTKGDKLRILVGHVGDGGNGLAGSGGTFVESVSLGLLVVSGGAGASNARQVTVGVTTQQASNWINPSGNTQGPLGLVGEAGGNSGYSSSNAVSMGGGGASYTQDGLGGSRQGSYGVTLVGAKSFKNGGAGGSATTQGGAGVSGGFGGGGACGGGTVSSVTLLGWGGGGGYTGGNGSTSQSTLLTPQGGSGGCFLSPLATSPSLTLRGASSSVLAGEANIRLVNLL